MLDTHTLRAGFEVQAWRGAKLSGSAGEQQVVEYGERKFAAFGLSQSLEVNRHLMIDGSIDMNKVLSGFDASRIVNVAQPVVNGGHSMGAERLRRISPR